MKERSRDALIKCTEYIKNSFARHSSQPNKTTKHQNRIPIQNNNQTAKVSITKKIRRRKRSISACRQNQTAIKFNLQLQIQAS